MAEVTLESLQQIQAYIEDPAPVHLTDKPKAAVSIVDQISEWLSLGAGGSTTLLTHVLGIPERTLARRKAAGTFSEDETDRIVRLLRVMAEVERMFHGSSPRAARWMTTPKRALGGITPLEASVTERGVLRVSTLIGQTMHGIVS